MRPHPRAGYVRFWSGSDPYAAAAATGAVALLEAVQSEWNANMRSIPRSSAFLFSGEPSFPLGGGR